jgi:hypothetical protein
MAGPPLKPPSPDTFADEERADYDVVLARERRKVESLVGAGRPAPISPLYVGLLQSPTMARRFAELTNFAVAGEARGSFDGRRRELVDVVLTVELETALVAFMHFSDAIAVGLAPATIEAILDREHERLDEADRVLVEHVIAVARGSSSAASYRAVVDLLGDRGAAEYTLLITCKLMVMRSVQAFTAATGDYAATTPWAPPSGPVEDWPADLARLREHLRAVAAGEVEAHDAERATGWIDG